MQSSKNQAARASDRISLWICLLLTLLVGVIYGQTLDHELLSYDDDGFVYNNPHVTAGLTGEGIRWAFSSGPYGEWYPLSTLSHMLDCQLFGLSAWGHHLTSLLLHAAASISLFLVWKSYTGELWPSAFVAILFAVHPQHVESVAWVAERRDVLSGLFFMLTLGAYLGYVRHGRSFARYLLVATLFALGLMSKPMLVTLPALLLVLDYWPLACAGAAIDVPNWTRSVERPGVRRLILEKLPLAALAVGDCLVTLGTHYAVAAPLGWADRLGNAAVACVNYAIQFFFPADLVSFYAYPSGGQPTWKVASAVVVLLTAASAAVIWRRKYPYLFVGCFWFLGMLVPVLGLIRISDHAMADRYMYLPSIGLSVAVTWGASRIPVRSRSLRCLTAGSVIVLLVACAAGQTAAWRNDETLWAHALEHAVASDRAEVGLGHALAQQGRIDEAVAHYRRGLALNPNLFAGHNLLGAALTRLGQFDEAQEHYRRALEIDPRGINAYLGLGRMLVFQGKFNEARAAFEKAIAIDPNLAPARNDLGSAFFLQGKIDESIPCYEAALAIDPNFVLAHVNLADALAVRGDVSQAEAHYRQALAIDPLNSLARQNLARLLRQGGSAPRE